MSLKIAINGFGRIGRLALRSIMETGRRDVRVVAVNDLGSVEANAHLLRYDSVHGRLPFDVKVSGDCVTIGGHPVSVFSVRDPSALPWGDLDVDIVYECTGIFTSREKAAAHLAAGAKRVLVSAPASGADRTVVFGVNHHTLTAADHVVSNASCTTNCLAPVAKVLHEKTGISRGYMTTIHAFTGDQPVLDTLHKDPYRSRAAAGNMIPTSTGAAKAVGLVLPDLDGKLDGCSVRVPTQNVSVIDLSFVSGRHTAEDEINAAMTEAAHGPLKGILDVTDEPLVSSDFNHNSHSATFALPQTRVMGGDLVRVMAWYDNEWGFSTRMTDTALEMARYL